MEIMKFLLSRIILFSFEALVASVDKTQAVVQSGNNVFNQGY